MRPIRRFQPGDSRVGSGRKPCWERYDDGCSGHGVHRCADLVIVEVRDVIIAGSFDHGP